MASCSSSFLLSSGSAFFLYPSWTRDGFPPLPSSLLSPWGSGGDPVTVSPFLRLRGRSTLWRPADRLSHHRLCHGATGSGSGPREPPFRKDPTYFAGLQATLSRIQDKVRLASGIKMAASCISMIMIVAGNGKGCP
ncbi:uncharacterized protein [Elaeis guineensis]|uniref:Uncharacterized protein LOC105047816 isoform X6 n=1 Tax=Elaeis guineensis var. tenera TaxID=51953 RepID=A0A6I9REE7_ELAGV|nr:uncharacterized protein LOC105047816 isoform X6 [Elaeis guineensis]